LLKENLIYLKKTVRVDQLKFNKSCTSFIGDLKKSVIIPKLSQSIPHLTQKTKFVIKKQEKEKKYFTSSK